MMRRVLRSRVRNAHVTATWTDGATSLKLDPLVMRAADLIAFEEVELVNVATGHRWQTYVEEGAPGEVRVHAASQQPTRSGDVVEIASWGLLHDGQTLAHRVKLVDLDAANQVVSLAES